MTVYQVMALNFAKTQNLPPGDHAVYVYALAPYSVVKADVSEHWITLKPHGPDSDAYVRVLIRQNQDGSAHVLSGGQGLRGLKLNKLKSPEEWKQNAKDRAANKKQQGKPDAQTAQAAQEHHQRIQAALQDRRLKQVQLAKELGLEGWDDPNLEKALTGQRREELEASASSKAEKGAAGLVASQESRKAASALKRLEQSFVRELAENHQLRQEVLEGGPAALTADEATNPAGFKKSLKAEAELKGADAEAIRQRKQDLFDQRIKELSESDPERAERIANQAALIKDIHETAKAIRGQGTLGSLSSTIDPKEIQTRAAKVKEFLRLAQEAKDLEAQARALDPNRGQDPEKLKQAIANRDPAEMDVDTRLINDEQFLSRLKQDVEELTKQDLTRSFLEKLEQQGGGSITTAREQMRHSHAFGAHTHFLSALSTTAGLGMDRLVSEVFGISGAAQIAARAMAQSLDPEALSHAIEGLQTYHDSESATAMRRALDSAEQAEAAASEIELPPVKDAASLAAARELNALRKDYLEEAMHNLGATLGQVEGGAALNLALRRGGAGDLELNLGKVDSADALWGLSALGLKEGEHYSAKRDAESNEFRVTLNQAGLDQLVTRPSAQEQMTRAHLEAIKRGEMDETDWLPAGFTSYPLNIHNDPERPKPFATPPGFMAGQSPAEGAEGFVASRLADGWLPSQIAQEMRSIDFISQYVPEGQERAYLDAVNQLFPLEREVMEDGSSGPLKNYDTDPTLQQRYGQMLARFTEAKGQAPLQGQSINPNDDQTRRAVFMALAENPATQAAFKPLGELTPDDQRGLRNYYYSHILKTDPASATRHKDLVEQAKKALAERGQWKQEPSQYLEDMQDMFSFGMSDTEGGGELKVPNPNYAKYHADLDREVEAMMGPAHWQDFVRSMRGLEHAYTAVQEHARGQFNQAFVKYHANLTGEPLRMGVARLSKPERIAAAMNPETRRQLLSQDASDRAKQQNRKGGQFAADDALAEKLARSVEERRAQSQMQSGLFFDEAPNTPEYQVKSPEVQNPLEQRYTLGARAEGEIASILPYVARGLKASGKGVKLKPGVTMGKGTRFVDQQRAVKFAQAAGKSYLALGAGSGKTAVAIGTFTQHHAQGAAKRSLFITPSNVRNQFGEEIARYTEPGKYQYHAQDAPFAERLEAYRNPDLHMMVVTHQGFRDDALKMMAQHQGMAASAFEGVFMNASPRQRRTMLRQALEAHGAADMLDYVSVDETHNVSGREGKPDALQQAVIDAAFQEGKHGTLLSGTPAKNDQSEVYDALLKTDPDRWEGKSQEFKRTYGVDLPAAQEAFKREAGRRIFASKIASGVNRRDIWGAEQEDGSHRAIPLHPEQQKGLDEVNAAYEAARAARREGGVDVEALKVLSPASFAGQTAQEHQTIAERLNDSLGTLRFAAQSRVVDAAPAEGNAKIRHLVALAERKRQAGHPGVVFAHSLEAVREIEKALKAAGHRVTTLTGADSSDSKAQKRQAFNPDQGSPEADILIASDAGAVGLNLQRGRWLANLDLPLTYTNHLQRNARIDRLGQQRDIEIHNLVSDSSYDRSAIERLERKRELQQVFEGDWSGLDDTGLAYHIARARASKALEPEGVEA